MSVLRPSFETVVTSIIGTLVIRAFGSFAIIKGILFILTDPARWDAPAYTLVSVVPFSPASWGLALVIGGVLVMIGSLTKRTVIKNLGLFLLGFLFISYGLGIAAAAFLYAYTGLTAGLDSLFLAVLAMLMAFSKES